MGVKGLWRLLMPIGRRISIETLEGRILAIDASIWLTQFLKAMRDPDTGSVRPAAHLVGFFRRLCKLRFQGIRPVLVFDGATPEIKLREIKDRRKRREQFGNHASGDSVQRMAKRLLALQLKKKLGAGDLAKGKGESSIDIVGEKSSASAVPSATAPGFYDPELDEAAVQSTPDGDLAQSAKQGIEASSEVIDVEEQEAVYLVDEHRNPETSDWDAIIIDSEEVEGHAVVPKNSTLLSSTKVIRKEKKEKPSPNGTKFDVEYVASLPSTARKDMVEEAQRSRRLQSRREFMKVAYDPEGLSKCQLRNFLRSSKLNQDIHAMARQAAQIDGVHDVSASDRTKKIVFEVETDNKKSHEDRKKKILKKVGKLKKASLLSPSLDSDDSDENIDWEAGDDHQQLHINRSTRAVMDDTSSSDTEDSTNGALKPKALPSLLGSPARTRSFRADAQLAQELEDEGIAFAIQQAEDEEEVAGGGFIPESPQDQEHRGDKQYVKNADFLYQATTSQHDTASVPLEGPDEHMLSSSTKSQSQSMGHFEKLAISSTERKAAIDLTKGLAELNGSKSSSDSDSQGDSIAWEDGDVDADTPVQNIMPMDNVGNNRGFEQIDGLDVSKISSKVAHDERLVDNLDEKSPMDKNPFQMKTIKDNENITKDMEDALVHAQATAANLTNWAGRAFRRAVAQHAEENGLKVPEQAIPHVTARKADNSDLNSKVVAVSQEQNVQQSRVSLDVDSKVVPVSQEQNAQKSRVSRSSGGSEPNIGRKASSAVSDAPSESMGEHVLETLGQYEKQWAKERSQKERDIDTVTDEMRDEAIRLLQLFGVPFVEAPAEAEAQCVELEQLGLVDGIVTEDSDVFVFGGRRVYKNIFDDQKYVEAYDSEEAKDEMNLTRDAFVALAMLLGGDYTEGVNGVGIVNGLEIVQAFDVSEDMNVGLARFRKWLDGFDPNDVVGNTASNDSVSSKEQEFNRKHQSARTRWSAPKFFPDPRVVTAYTKPVVDTSTENFSWGIPDVEGLVLFFNKHAGWSVDETRKQLDPVVKRLQSKTSYQTRIDSFMRYEDGIKFADVRSKRLRDVLETVRNDSHARKKGKARPT